MDPRRRAARSSTRTSTSRRPAAIDARRYARTACERLIDADGRPAARRTPSSTSPARTARARRRGSITRAAGGARPDRRHLHQPAPRADQRAHQPQRRADRRRGPGRADRGRSPTSRRWPACDPSYFEIAHRGRLPLVRRRRRRRRGGRGRPARPVGRHQRRRRRGRGGHQRRRSTTPSSPGRRWRDDRRGEGGHRQARQHPRARRDRPRAASPIFRAAGAATASGAGRRLRRASRTSSRVGGRLLDAAHAVGDLRRASSCRCTARTRATTPAVALAAVGGVLRRAARRGRGRARRFADGPRCRVASRSLGHQPAGHRRRRPQPGGRRRAAPAVLFDDFDPVGQRILRRRACSPGAIPATMLERAAAPTRWTLVICCTPSTTPRAMPAAEVAGGGARASAATTSSCTDDVGDAVRRRAGAAPAPTTLVLVTGSLYVVGAARPHLRTCSGRADRRTGRLASLAMPDRTLVICKPDAVERGLVGEIVGRFERKGLRIVAAELRTLDESHRGPPLRRARRQAASTPTWSPSSPAVPVVRAWWSRARRTPGRSCAT